MGAGRWTARRFFADFPALYLPATPCGQGGDLTISYPIYGRAGAFLMVSFADSVIRG